MQSKSDFGTVVWSGSSVCLALESGFNTSRAFMEYEDQIQLSHRFPILWLRPDPVYIMGRIIGERLGANVSARASHRIWN